MATAGWLLALPLLGACATFSQPLEVVERAGLGAAGDGAWVHLEVHGMT